jgi:hypothetical protein
MKFSAEFETMIDDMLEAGKKRETFDSQWASPLCLLRKKDKSSSVTVDYGHLSNGAHSIPISVSRRNIQQIITCTLLHSGRPSQSQIHSIHVL